MAPLDALLNRRMKEREAENDREHADVPKFSIPSADAVLIDTNAVVGTYQSLNDALDEKMPCQVDLGLYQSARENLTALRDLLLTYDNVKATRGVVKELYGTAHYMLQRYRAFKGYVKNDDKRKRDRGLKQRLQAFADIVDLEREIRDTLKARPIDLDQKKYRVVYDFVKGLVAGNPDLQDKNSNKTVDEHIAATALYHMIVEGKNCRLLTADRRLKDIVDRAYMSLVTTVPGLNKRFVDVYCHAGEGDYKPLLRRGLFQNK